MFISVMLWTILIIALVLRIGVAMMLPDHFLFPDSYDYHQIATNFLRGDGLILGHYAVAVRPPLYPLILAGLYSIGFEMLHIRIFQAILGTIWVFIQAQIAWKMSQNKYIVLIAASFMAIDPLIIPFDGLILTENMFLGLFMTLIYLLILPLPSQDKTQNHSLAIMGRGLLIGCVLGIACLCRDALLGFIMFVVLWGIWYWKKKYWYMSIAFVLGTILVITPYTYRNYRYLGQAVVITSKGGQNLYEAFGPGATGGINILCMKLPDEVHTLNEAQRDTFLTRWTLQYICKNPGSAIRLIWEKQTRFWNIRLNYSEMVGHPIQNVLSIFNCLLYFFAILGFYYIFFRQNNFNTTVGLLLLLGIMYFTCLHMFFLGSVRYRLPIIPLLDIFAGCGLYWSWKRLCWYIGRSYHTDV